MPNDSPTAMPTESGLYAFRGYRRTPSGQLVQVQDAVRVEPASWTRRQELAVRMFNGVVYPLGMFEGEWTPLILPW